MKDKAETAGSRIRRLTTGEFATLKKINPSGALQARKLSSGAIVLYWRYTFKSKTEREHIGHYDSLLPPRSLEATEGRFSIAAATRAAENLAKRHQDALTVGGLKGLVKMARDAETQATLVEASRRAHTLEKLALTYCDHLENKGRPAHRDARSIFRLHLIAAWPHVAGRAANEVTSEELADVLRPLFNGTPETAPKGRTGNKLRSYLRAAYELALRARKNPKSDASFIDFNVSINPVTTVDGDPEANRADKNPLTAAAMIKYWKSIEHATGIKGALLRLHLLTGAQRIEQFVKLRTSDIQPDEILLFDGKGRLRALRPHPIPLIEEAKAALQLMMPTGEFALSTDGGKTHIAATTLSSWSKEYGASITEFKAKRLRSGVETILSKAKVGREIRGRLQSHGISGVQAKSYDGHDYMDEKLDALKVLFRLLNAPS